MSDFSRSFNPWGNNFTKVLYLAGVEVMEDAKAPQGWIKWTIPSYEYIYVKNESTTTFSEIIKYLIENDILTGAVHDFNFPETGQGYLSFPVRRL